ncbi:MAG: phosphatidylserine/phosphatidylglycerophosphate/cardiolipin synthase family protein [Planctomycetaceae bacterium]|nr:phosphatidylserine/phosphatidylglycerophosphate/cardiolipin synthase family protein [Planctomycetaceae bacterium]
MALWHKAASITVLSLGLALAGLGCTAFPMKSQQVWRSFVEYEYPSAPVGSAEFEAALDRYTGSVARPVEESRLLQNGAEAYPAMLELIDGARESISFETYIIENDDTTDRFFAALKAAAARGVRVRVLVDAAGFHRGLIAQLNELSEAGVEARVFNPFFASWTIVRGNNRDHRKILAVDSRHAILGGINLSDIQTGDGISGWRDTALFVSGPAALDAERVFDQTWRQGGRGWVGKTLPVVCLNPVKQALERPFVDDDAPAESRSGEALASPLLPTDGQATVRVIASTPDARNSTTYDMAILGVAGARERLDIAVAYFVPPLNLRRALLDAAGRGVRVRLLLPGVTDVRMVREMGMRFFGELLQAGIEIYEWPYLILHAKTMAVDGRWLVVGSANMDSRSYFLNYEACLALSSPEVAGQAHEQFDRDLLHASRVTLESWRARSVKQKILEPLLIPAAGQY